LLVILALIVSGCSAEGSGSARPLNAQELRGRDLFQAACSQCHNAYKKEPLQGPPVVGLFRKKEMPSGIPATDPHVRDTILLGRRNMPPFNGMLDDRQLSDLMAFLHTL
jgi:mono/diheme cytochrome c family protein